MRVQCDVCEKAEAALVCCADEAALCAACDSQVHAANKLAGKHQRLPLIRPSQQQSPSCDICQERTGWFFCVEDRALLCRSCDVTIHSSNALASGHKRYLITGVRVSLNALSPQDFLDSSNLPPPATTATTPQTQTQTQTSQTINIVHTSPSTVSGPEPGPANGAFEVESGTSLSRTEPAQSSVMEKRGSSTISEYLTEAVPGWRVDELLNIPDLASGYSIADVGSSKADATNLGEFDWLADVSMFDEQSYADTFHEVPQLGSIPGVGAPKPTAVSKGKSKMSMAVVPESDDSLLVPDMFLPAAKRRRAFLTA